MPDIAIVRMSAGGTGPWTTEPEAVGAGGGSVSEITSDDNSVTVTNPTGPTVDLSVSGGSQTSRVVRVPIMFDTADIVPVAYPITAVDVPGNTFTIAGDHVAVFSPPDAFSVYGSTGNDNPGYPVTAASLVAGDTVIQVGSGPFDTTADGFIANTGRAGITLAVMGELDFLPVGDIQSHVQGVLRLPVVWDGTSPTLHITTTEGRAAGLDFTTLPLDTNGDADYFGDGVYFYVDAANLFTIPFGYFALASEIVAYIDDGNGADPGAMQGEAELILAIWSAP